MKSTLSMEELEEQSYSTGDEVMYAHLQAADVRGYNRTATVTRVLGRGEYEIKDERNETHRVSFEDIAPLSSKA